MRARSGEQAVMYHLRSKGSGTAGSLALELCVMIVDRVQHFRQDMNASVEDLSAFHSCHAPHMLSTLYTEIGRSYDALNRCFCRAQARGLCWLYIKVP